MKLLDRLYEKSHFWFAIVWIVAYVLVASYGDAASAELGVTKLVTAPALIASASIRIAIQRTAVHFFSIRS